MVYYNYRVVGAGIKNDGRRHYEPKRTPPYHSIFNNKGYFIMKDYDLDPFDNNLLQFSKALAALAGVLDDETIGKAAGSMGISPESLKTLLARSEKVSSDFELLKDEDPMITRRARATINGDRDFTVNYDDGLEVVATDGGTLFDIDLNDDGSLEVSVHGCAKHKGTMLDDCLLIEPLGNGRLKLRRTEY